MNSGKISGIILYTIVAISVVIFGMFFFGNVETETVPGLEAPVYTNLLMIFMYILFGIAFVITGAAAISSFYSEFKKSPAEAVKSIAGIVGFALILVISWYMGDGTALFIRGYEGSENVPFWLKWTDMILYTSYILFVITVLCIFAGSFMKKFSNK